MNENKKAAAPMLLRGAAKLNIKPTQSNHNSLSAQRTCLLEALSERALTTLEIRALLDIVHPAGRVFELRRMGHDIMLTRVYQPTESGRFHRVGLYTLMPRRRGGRHAQ